jgi:hypothetical protein
VIERVIQMVIANAYPTSADGLAGFAVDAEHYLGRTGTLQDIEIHQAGRPECLLEIRAAVAERTGTLQEVSTALREAWLALAYAEFEAASSVRYSDATVFRFVTAMDRGTGGVLYVTGEIVVDRGPYPRLVDRFEREFGDLQGGLTPRPGREA